jgi:hypothetical protein
MLVEKDNGNIVCAVGAIHFPPLLFKMHIRVLHGAKPLFIILPATDILLLTEQLFLRKNDEVIR